MAADGVPYLDNAELLGKSIKLLPNENNPFEVNNLIRRARRIVELSDTEKTVGQARGQGFRVPKNIDYVGIHETNTHSLKVETGTDLSHSLDTNAEASASYAGISAEGSVKYSYQTALSASKYYGVVSTEHQSFTLTLKLPHGKLDLDDGQELFQQYQEFFRTWGTYLIRSCSFGARYQLRVESHITDTKNKEDFEAHISAEYNGVASVKGSAGLKTTSEYQTYEKVRKFQAKVIGGDIGKNADLSSSPDDPAKFDEWEQSIQDSTANDPINFGVMSLGDIVKECKDLDNDTRKGLATRLNRSLSYLNSFKIVQGYMSVTTDYAYGHSFEFSMSGPPGMEVHAHPIEKFVKVTKVSPTHVKIYCSESEDVRKMRESRSVTFITAEWKLAYIRISAPVLPLELKFTTPPLITMSLNLTEGPTINATSHNLNDWTVAYNVDSLFQPGEYPK